MLLVTLSFLLFTCRLVQIFDPVIARGLDIPECLNALAAFHPFNAQHPFHMNLLDRMSCELPKYKAAMQMQGLDATQFNATKPIEFTQAVLDFWRRCNAELPAWAEAAQMVFCSKPSSAGAERGFSLMNNSFGADRSAALMDMVEGTMMVQFNDSMRQAEFNDQHR